MRRSSLVAFVAAAAAVVALAGCGNSGSPNPGPSAPNTQSADPSTSPASTSSPTSTPSSAPTTTPNESSSAPADPRVAAALKVYLAFSKTVAFTYMHPPKKIGNPLPSGGNFRPYSFDPAQGQVLNDVFSLTQLQVAYRGTPAISRPTVSNVDLTAKPYPTVTLTDCPVPANWKIVATSPGPPPTVKSSAPGAPAPNLITAKVIFYEKHWGVSTMTTNISRTCTP